MNKIPFKFATLLVAAFALPTHADEIETNHPAASSQGLSASSGEMTLPAVLGNGGKGDLDYFSFNAKVGDVVDVDIDGGYDMGTSVHTIIAVFGPGPEFARLRSADRAPDGKADEGSVSWRDPRIEKFVVPQTGRYPVGVSNYGRPFVSGGGTIGSTVKEGDYTLVITGVSPDVVQIAIDIKPGSDGRAPINTKSRGKIPVALLGSADFNAMSVDPESLTFGSTGSEASLSKCNWTGEDVNGDGHVDRVCHFENQLAAFKQTDLEGTLRGKTQDGIAFEGRGDLKVLPYHE